MSTEPLKDDDEELERQLQFSHLAGKATAWEDVAAWLGKDAAGTFLTGDDKLANRLRDLSSHAKNVAESLREQQGMYS